MTTRPMEGLPHQNYNAINGLSNGSSNGSDRATEVALNALSTLALGDESESINPVKYRDKPHLSQAPVDAAKIEAALAIGGELQRQGIRGKIFAVDHEGLCRNLFITDELVFVHLNKVDQKDPIVGEGGMGKKFKFAAGSDGKKYVISSWRKSCPNVQKLQKEIQIMEKLGKKPGVLELICHLDGTSKKQPETKTYMITPFCEGGDLFDLIMSEREISEVEKVQISLNILNGVKELHKADIIHRDLKPENVLIPNSQVVDELVVADFNLAEEKSKLKATSRCGTYEYMAPEIICAKSNGIVPYTEKSDAYAAGVVMYILKTKSFPPHSERSLRDSQKSLAAMGNREWLTPLNDGSFDDVMAGLVRFNPDVRMSVTNAIAQLEALRDKMLARGESYDPLDDDDFVL